MTGTESVTEFSLEDAQGQPVTVSAIVEAINEYCRPWLTGESFGDRSTWEPTRKGETLPERWRYLVAYCVDGDCEGWYVHIGCMVNFGYEQTHGDYIDFGHAKLWTAADAYTVAREAQRFLSACRWN
jgi:hypothetical protein